MTKEEYYAKQAERADEIPFRALGQQVKTEDGVGIIIELQMPANGLYISPEQSKCIVWYGTDRATPWVQKEYQLNKTKPVMNLDDQNN